MAWMLLFSLLIFTLHFKKEKMKKNDSSEEQKPEVVKLFCKGE